MRASAAVVALLATCLVSGRANAQSQRVEKKRQEILDKLGLDRSPTTPKPDKETPPEGDPAADATETEAESPAANAAEGDDAAAKAKPVPSFRRQIHPWLSKSCAACHQKGGPAGSTAFLIGAGLAADHANVLRHVNTQAPARSALVQEATGRNHGGGAIVKPNAPEVRRLVAWIAAGAALEDAALASAGGAAAAPPTATTGSTRPRRAADRARAEAPRDEAMPTPATVEVAGAPPTDATSAPPSSGADLVSSSGTARPVAFARKDTGPSPHRVLLARCGSCHGPSGMAAKNYLLRDDVEADYAASRALVQPGEPQASRLLQRATGQAHMPVLNSSDEAYRQIAAWIQEGAHGPFAAAVAPPVGDAANASPGSEESPEAATNDQAPAPLPPPPPEGVHAANRHAAYGGAHGGGLPLPIGMRLNGRFDMAFERRGLNEHPLGSGQTLFQNYHHFLFLSRDEADDPITFTVELVALTFWEMQLRVTPRNAPLDLRLKMGKLIVPFGAEPLFHQSYGGLQGFDQRVLPVFWAQHGFGARLTTNIKEASLLADAYVIRGYGLREETGILNLQSEFSPTDDVRPAYGLRLNLSWRALSGYYSLLVNGLGFGRTLVLQAIDLSSWRWRGVPVLERFSFGLGFLRADVSGGGAGEDYYHFASYYQVRYYILDGLFLQYRQGLRTFNNRRGFYQDTTRFTEQDGSAHNIGLVWRRRGLSVGAYQFWNLEKANEVRDDFFRVLVAYEF